jgi:hypothetical protein
MASQSPEDVPGPDSELLLLLRALLLRGLLLRSLLLGSHSRITSPGVVDERSSVAFETVNSTFVELGEPWFSAATSRHQLKQSACHDIDAHHLAESNVLSDQCFRG